MLDEWGFKESSYKIYLYDSYYNIKINAHRILNDFSSSSADLDKLKLCVTATKSAAIDFCIEMEVRRAKGVVVLAREDVNIPTN